MYCKTEQKTKVLIDGSYLIYSTYFNANYIYKKRFPKKKLKDIRDYSPINAFIEIWDAEGNIAVMYPEAGIPGYDLLGLLNKMLLPEQIRKY